MRAEKVHAQTIFPWLRANLGKGCLAPLTHRDGRALRAAVQIIELYAYDQDQAVIAAFGRIVSRMQPSTRELAYHGIAHVMDWSDRARLWELAGLPELLRIRRCEFEPKEMGAVLG